MCIEGVQAAGVHDAAGESSQGMLFEGRVRMATLNNKKQTLPVQYRRQETLETFYTIPCAYVRSDILHDAQERVILGQTSLSCAKNSLIYFILRILLWNGVSKNIPGVLSTQRNYWFWRYSCHVLCHSQSFSQGYKICFTLKYCLQLF